MTPARRLEATDAVLADAWSNGRCALTLLAAASPLSELLSLIGGEPGATTDVSADSLPTWRVRSGAALLIEGARSSHLYVVRTGTFKCTKTGEDGYEQVLGFVGQGDVLAFEAMCGDCQHMGVIALEDASVFALSVRDLDARRHRSSVLDQALQVALSRQLTRASEMTELMAAVSSDVRLARFILWWSARMAKRGQSPRRLLLRMSRRDIASLLGVAHETVSRSFSTFVEHGLLRVDNREIEIVDLEGLKARTRNTRGLADDMAHPAAGRRPVHDRPRRLAVAASVPVAH